MNVTEDTTALLMSEADTSPFEDLISRPPESVGAPSLFFFPNKAQYVTMTLLLNLKVVMEIFDMVQLVKEAF